MEFDELIRSRYSVRSFSGEAVGEEKIERIVASGMCAPTAKNKQPVKMWLFKSDEAREKLAGTTPFPFVRKAAAVIAVGSKADAAWIRRQDGKNFADIDAAIVATHIMLSAHAEGLGTTWVGSFDEPLLKSLFPDMAGYSIIALFPIGYPSADSAPLSLHDISKPKDEMLAVV